MGKRKSSMSLMNSPKKEKKPEKLPEPIDSSDSEREEEEEQAVSGDDNTVLDESKQVFSQEPDTFRGLAKSFQEYISRSKQISVTVHNMEKIVTEWASETDEMIDAGAFIVDYRKYLRNATKLKNFQIGDSCSALDNYLCSEKALNDFNTLPKAPASRIHLYMKANKIPFKMEKDAVHNTQQKMQNDAEGMRKVDETIKELSLQYAAQLQNFLGNHPDLTHEQKKHIENRIKSVNKKYIPKEAVQRTPKKKNNNKKEPETAFSLFCRSKNEKYRDLSDEEREKKLRKKFDKLPEETRELFESLALNIN